MIGDSLVGEVMHALIKAGLVKPGNVVATESVVKEAVVHSFVRDNESMIAFLDWWASRAHQSYHVPIHPEPREWRICPAPMCESMNRTIEEIGIKTRPPTPPAIQSKTPSASAESASGHAPPALS